MANTSVPHSSESCDVQCGNLTLHERVSPVHYTVVDNDILYLHADTKDFAARVLCYLTTRPRPWTLSEGAIAAQFGVDIQKVKRAMSHLTKLGYVRSRRRLVRYGIFEPGKVSRNTYVWDWHVYEVPRMNPDFVKANRFNPQDEAVN